MEDATLRLEALNAAIRTLLGDFEYNDGVVALAKEYYTFLSGETARDGEKSNTVNSYNIASTGGMDSAIKVAREMGKQVSDMKTAGVAYIDVAPAPGAARNIMRILGEQLVAELKKPGSTDEESGAAE